MIKQIKIKNIYGINEFNVDFSLKNIQEEKILENQIIMEANNALALSPLFLAKNAAGKTSFIKALSFIFMFLQKEKFIRNMIFYKSRTITKEIETYRSEHESMTSIKVDEQYNWKDHEIQAGDFVVENLYKEIKFAGSESSLISMKLTENREISLEISKSSFVLNVNGNVLDIKYILNSLQIENPASKAPNSMINEINSKLEKIDFFSQFNSKDLNADALFRDVEPITKIGEINVKNLTNYYINAISNKIGVKEIVFLLKKLDPNISYIDFDNESKAFNIYLNSIDKNWPINPNVLSFGTQKFIEIFAKSLKLFEHGGIMLIDEIENGLHLSIIKLLINLYSDPEVNKENAQIILTTHNPLIAEREIVTPKNVFMEENNNFVNIKNIERNSKRTEDILAMIKSKNYYSDIFWASKNSTKKSTLSNHVIRQIINKFSESEIWQKK